MHVDHEIMKRVCLSELKGKIETIKMINEAYESEISGEEKEALKAAYDAIQRLYEFRPGRKK